MAFVDDSMSEIDEMYRMVRAHLPATEHTALPRDAVLHVELLGPTLRRIQLISPTLPPATHTAMYIVGASQAPGQFILIDAGSPYPDELHALQTFLASEAACGRTLLAAAFTHHHGDHTGSGAMLAAMGCPLWAHAETATRCASRFPIARQLVDGEQLVLEVGGGASLALTAVHTPGHAPGHLCFALPSHEGVVPVLAGDMVAGIGTILIDPSDGDMCDYLASLNKLLRLGPTVLHPAHGPSSEDGQAKLRGYLAHRLAREAAILNAVRKAAAPQSLAQLVAVAYREVPEGLWPLAQRSLAAHLRKLQQEQLVLALADGRWAASSV